MRLTNLFAIVAEVDRQECVLHRRDGFDVPMIATSLEGLRLHFPEANRICGHMGWRWRAVRFDRQREAAPRPEILDAAIAAGGTE